MSNILFTVLVYRKLRFGQSYLNYLLFYVILGYQKYVLVNF